MPLETVGCVIDMDRHHKELMIFRKQKKFRNVGEDRFMQEGVPVRVNF